MFDEARCTRCGDCLVNCLYVDYNQDRAVKEIEALIAGKSTEIVSLCATCIACNTICPEDANPFDLILKRQEETQAVQSPKGLALAQEWIDSPGEIIRGEPDRPVISLCVVEPLIPRMFEGQLYQGMTYLKGGDFFCYIGYCHMGQESPIGPGLKRMVENLARSRAEEIIFFHDECYAAVKSLAPAYGVEVPFRPINIITYLRDYLRDHPNEIHPLDLKAAYQQPCSSRYSMEKDSTVDELFELMGVERVARKFDRQQALCCGAPMVGFGHRKKANDFSARNVEDAKTHGAELMVFLCPMCTLRLRRISREAGLKPIHLSNLARLALGEELPPETT
jgi:Fe-S oxidoreductase